MLSNARPWLAQSALLSLALGAILATSGCGGRGAGGLFFAPENNPLRETTKALRQPMAPPVPRELDKQVLPRYVVEPGDVLLVLPSDPDSTVRLPADQPVLLDGTINLGRYGHVIAAGKTIEEIEAIVRAAVETQTKDAGFISVRLVGRQSKVYYVLGEVNSPGSFPLAGRETVLDGILAAGGLTDRASRKKIVVSRPTPPHDCRIVLPVCYEEIVQIGDTTTNYQLRPGDRIFVASRSCWDNILGDKKECAPCAGPQTACPMEHAPPPVPSHQYLGTPVVPILSPDEGNKTPAPNLPMPSAVTPEKS